MNRIKGALFPDSVYQFAKKFINNVKNLNSHTHLNEKEGTDIYKCISITDMERVDGIFLTCLLKIPSEKIEVVLFHRNISIR